MGRIVGKAILCFAAGVVGWVLTIAAFPGNPADPAWTRAELIFALLVSALIAGTAGLVQGLQQGGRTNVALSIGISLLIGTLAGSLGLQIGGGLAQAFFGPSWTTATTLNLSTMIARTLVGVCWGAGLGAGVGAALRSVRGTVSGLVGGVVGGGIAGLLFDPLGAAVAPTLMAVQTSNEVGVVSRGLMAGLLGFGIGLFTALFERLSRQAWVRLMLGRNEGREWPVDAAQTLIGRDERAHIPLFSEPGIPPMAAVIQRHGAQYL
ncbi:MAG: hypothetical protein MH204_12345, partial [Fimbriimonadaceae bacterium]|nr:hypothetical protein [Fimbriimonadaceae bacterium]